MPSAMPTAVREVEPGQGIERGVEGEAADHAQRMRVGERRAVAVEVRQHMQARGERLALLGAQRGDPLQHPAWPGRAERRALGVRRPGCGRAGRRSPTGRPRSATARARPRRSRGPRRPRTRRGSADSAMWQVEVPAISAILRSSSAPLARAPDRARRARRHGHRSGRSRPWHAVVSARSAAAARGERAERRADRHSPAPAARSARAGPRARRREEIVLPARLLVSQIGPFAGHRAARAGVRAAGAQGEEVGEVEHPAVARPGLRQMALEPHQLRDLHLGRHRAAEQVEHPMAGGGARLAPRRSPDDRARRRRSSGPRRWSRRSPDGPRWSRATSEQVASNDDAGHLLGGNAGARARLAHRLGDRGPDVLRTLLGVVGHRPVERDRALGAPQHPTVRAEHARACAARPDVDRDQSCTGIVTLPAVSMVLRAAPLCLPIALNGDGCQADPCANGCACRLLQHVASSPAPPGRRRRAPARRPCRICTLAECRLRPRGTLPPARTEGRRRYAASASRQSRSSRLALHHATIVDSPRSVDINGTTIRFEAESRPAKRNCKLGVCQRSAKILIYLSKVKWVPNGPSERPQRKPGIRE